MKSVFLTVLLSLFFTLTFSAKDDVKKSILPELNKIRSATLSPSYSCRSSEEWSKGYDSSSLYLSDRRFEDPDLLFNGACGSGNTFGASFSGDDMSLIADLGENVSLEEISAQTAFSIRNIGTYAEFSKFTRSADVVAKHTYAVLINRNVRRSLFVFTVDTYVPDKKVDIRYAVKSFEVFERSRIFSPGFDWQKKSSVKTVAKTGQ